MVLQEERAEIRVPAGGCACVTRQGGVAAGPCVTHEGRVAAGPVDAHFLRAGHDGDNGVIDGVQAPSSCHVSA